MNKFSFPLYAERSETFICMKFYELLFEVTILFIICK